MDSDNGIVTDSFPMNGSFQSSGTAVKSMPDLVMVPVLSKTITEIFPATGILNIPRNLEATRYF